MIPGQLLLYIITEPVLIAENTDGIAVGRGGSSAVGLHGNRNGFFLGSFCSLALC